MITVDPTATPGPDAGASGAYVTCPLTRADVDAYAVARGWHIDTEADARARRESFDTGSTRYRRGDTIVVILWVGGRDRVSRGEMFVDNLTHDTFSAGVYADAKRSSLTRWFNGGTAPRHIDSTYVLERARDIGSGWRRYLAELLPGETAVDPTSTKYVLVGPGYVEYFVHATGWDVVTAGPHGSISRIPDPAHPAR